MTSISTTATWARIQQANLLTRNRIDFYNEQISSGLKGNTYGDFSPSDSRVSLDLRPVIDRIDVQQRNIAEARSRTEVMEVALKRMDEIMKGIETDLTNALGATEFDMTVVNQRARQALDEIGALLNTQVNGRYVFAGAESATAPVNVGALQAFVDYMVAEVTPAEYGGNAANIRAGVQEIGLRRSTTGVTPAVGAPFAGATGFEIFTPAVTAAANDRAVTVRIEDDIFTQLYGVPGYSAAGAAGASQNTQPQNLRADAFQFREMIIGLTMAASLRNPANPAFAGADGADGAAFTDLVNAARDSLRSARANLSNQTGILGNTAAKIRDVGVRLEQTQNALQKQLGQAEDVDVADAISKLQLAQTQLQASYNVTATLRQLTLVNFL
jgi:flagellar hook-associated protein 3 FlgL